MKTPKVLRPVFEKGVGYTSVFHLVLLICLIIPNDGKLSVQGQ